MKEFLKRPWEQYAVSGALSLDETGDPEAGYGSSGSSDSNGMPLDTGMYLGGSTYSPDAEMHSGSEDIGGNSDDWASAVSTVSECSEELAEDYVYGMPHRRDSLPYANDAQADFITQVQDCWDQHCDLRFSHSREIEEWAWATGPGMSPIVLNLEIYPAVAMEYAYIRKSRLALRARAPIADQTPVPKHCICARNNQCRLRRNREEFERLSCDCLPPLALEQNRSPGS